MKLLAWDTSSKEGSIAALEWNEREAAPRAGWRGIRLAAEWALNVDMTHSERLLWGIHQTLEAARWNLDQVDLFAVGVGPGSFTGLRIGLTTARTLAHTLGKPLIGVSSLAALARPAALAAGMNGGKALVVAASDACKGEVFALWGHARFVTECVALADGDRAGLWKRGVDEKVIAPAELAKALKKKLGPATSGVSWIAVGEAIDRYPEIVADLPVKRRIELTLPFSHQVQGRYVGLLAWEAHQAGLAEKDPLRVHPRYLRAPDAELKLKAGLLPQGPFRGGDLA